MNINPKHTALIEIQRLFDTRGTLVYGEAINQIEHALQCGTLAQNDGAPETLVLASWLHDVGHMQHKDAATAAAEGRDDMYESFGAKFLDKWFGPAVAEPIRMHIEAKCYLSKTEPGYWEQLSPLLKRTLETQGGPMTDAEVSTFEKSPYFAEAVRLRHWADIGKQPSMKTASYEHFMAIASRHVRPI